MSTISVPESLASELRATTQAELQVMERMQQLAKTLDELAKCSRQESINA